MCTMPCKYDARKNIYYYETFKNQIDSIIDRETRQGLRFNFNYKPFKTIAWGGTAGYRYKKSDNAPSINANTYVSVAKTPFLNALTTIDATYLRSPYQNGFVYGASVSKDLFNETMYGELKYRLVNYDNTNSTSSLVQNMLECSLSWRMANKWMITTNVEATLEKTNLLGRLYLNVTKRF